ncbi:FG-GAP repeat protein [Niabella hibiscisoli]|uniref:FG-GAP repeat protein n=1 Tax=Niabella hibiscisoli TaxID=1825928 RepID=UPI001F107012|nr:FG-GAP repeat protein [Niabella hibiscisoli]MCH5720141.1 FG-GAP repeat protein [Niabella hibiscisoli]
MMYKTLLISFSLMLSISVQAQFTKQVDISANDKRADAFLGTSVSVSGNLAVAGANGDNAWRGAAYVYEKMVAPGILNRNWLAVTWQWMTTSAQVL